MKQLLFRTATLLFTVLVFISVSKPLFAGTCPVGTQVSCNPALWHVGNGHTISGFAGQGVVRIWTNMGGGQRLQVSKNGSVIQNLYPTSGIATTINVVATDSISINTFDCYSGNCNYADYGWKTENTGAYANTCGTGCPCPDKANDGNYGLASSSGFRSMVENGDNGTTIGPLQCWGDWAENSWDRDFNDFNMWYTFEATCNCNPIACPAGDVTSKFMTRTISQGTGLTCNNCVPSVITCPPLYRNTAPTCSINPASIAMARGDSPRTFTLTVNDMDYGDTVQTTKVRIIDNSGNLKSCAKLSTLAGGSVENLTVKNGSDIPGNTSQVTSLLADSREAHGIFDNVGGQSVCSGFLEVEIRDLDLDGGGPDVSNTATCRISLSVTNQAPQLTDVSLYDRDAMVAIRDMGATGTGDLIDGRQALFVGSNVTTVAKARASSCSEELSIVDPIKCRGGAEVYEANMSRRRNPLQLEFTVHDSNGIKDILQAGVWLQRVAQNKDSVVLPPAQTGTRHSFQALYSEKENMQVAVGSNRWDFISRACLGSSCGPQEINTSAKQLFSGLALIDSLGAFEGVLGNYKQGKMQWSSQRDWQEVGFPDCLTSVSGCSLANVAVNSQSVANGNMLLLSNYDWAIAADATHLICYPSDSLVPRVVLAGSPIVVCPSTCAACIKKEGVSTVPGDVNALRFKFGLYFNDKDGGQQGMTEGDYAIFLSALDKVSVPLNNVTGKGDDGWVKFDRNGVLCTGATCAIGTDFTLKYDPVAPTVNYVSWASVGLTGAKANFNLADNATGSGIAGVTNRFMARQEVLDGEPLGDRTWTSKASSPSSLFNGSNDKEFLSASQTFLEGTGLTSGDDIVAGLCVFDNAGNMSCGRNGGQYIFLAPWLKTSYGDIFSAKGGAIPFTQSLPSDDGTTLDNTSSLYSPYSEQVFTVSTGMLMTGGTEVQGVGLTGGHLEGSENKPLGFLANYRTSTSPFNVYEHTPFLVGKEFDRLKASAVLNCSLMNTNVSTNCQTEGSLGSLGQAQYNLIFVASAKITGTLVCTNSNVIFVTGTLEVEGQVTKATTGTDNGCIFVLAEGATIQLKDTPSDVRLVIGSEKAPFVDRFDAAIVANSGAQIQVPKGTRGALTKSTDRLEIRGWLYAANMVPTFKRDLAPVDNRRYPAEYIVYDATLLDVFRPLLGVEKTVDLSCGTSEHVLCITAN